MIKYTLIKAFWCVPACMYLDETERQHRCIWRTWTV